MLHKIPSNVTYVLFGLRKIWQRLSHEAGQLQLASEKTCVRPCSCTYLDMQNRRAQVPSKLGGHLFFARNSSEQLD